MSSVWALHLQDIIPVLLSTACLRGTSQRYQRLEIKDLSVALEIVKSFVLSKKKKNLASIIFIYFFAKYKDAWSDYI